MKKCTTVAKNGSKKMRKKTYGGEYILTLFREEPMIMIMETVIMTFTYCLPVIFSKIWTELVNQVSAGEKWQVIGIIGLMTIGGLNNSYFWFTEAIDTSFRNKASIAMQKKIHKKSQALALEEFDSSLSNSIIERSREVFSYGDGLEFLFTEMKLISSLVSWMAAMWLAFSYHPVVSTIFIMLPIGIALKLIVSRKILSLTEQMTPDKRKAEDLASYLTQYEKIKETKVHEAGPFLLSKWGYAIRDYIEKKKKIRIINIRTDLVNEIIDCIIYGLSIGLCITLYSKDKLTVGEIGGIILLVTTLKGSMSRLVDAIANMSEVNGYVNQGFKMFELKEDDGMDNLNEDEKISEIELDNVSFQYENQSGYAIQNVSIQLKKGDKLAIVGENGAGKSTLTKLIMGLYQPSTGKVLYDSVDIHDYKASMRYRHSASVFQDFNKYGFTFKENITFGQDSKKASNILHRFNFLNDLEQGGDTLLRKDFGGRELSGGQWQEIAIARALYKDTDIVIFDEPTSAIDPLREKALYKEFEEAMEGKIGIIVTHRLGAASIANRILVMDHGEVIEDGTHEELLAQNGLYAKMYTAQASMYLD